MEFATPYAGGIDVLRQFHQHKVLGLGVVDHTDAPVESPEQIAERAMEFVPM